jgi:hypothetical protein
MLLLGWRDEMGGTCGTLMGEVRYAYKVLVGKPEGKKPSGRHRNK